MKRPLVGGLLLCFVLSLTERRQTNMTPSDLSECMNQSKYCTIGASKNSIPKIVSLAMTLSPKSTSFFSLILALSSSSECGFALAPTRSFTTASGLPVSRYGLGGAARRTQPSSLVSAYIDEIEKEEGNVNGAPFLFYYNPHRYSEFMSGIKTICSTQNREDIFVVSGGTDRSIDALDQRLSDCLKYCGEKYLDMFILEYVLPYELDAIGDSSSLKPGPELASALKHTRTWLENGSVRSIGISTHSHVVGRAMAYVPEIDALMLRYGMSHKDAAENMSLPAAKENGKAVIAFTSTRWNSLQDGTNGEEWDSDDAPTSADCLSFVFGSKNVPSPVDAVLHSARNEDELFESMSGLRVLSQDDETKWRKYGEIFEPSNDDNFDEYPEERLLKIQ
jgi:diketogulonate reductase-like aldo/keto reductase